MSGRSVARIRWDPVLFAPLLLFVLLAVLALLTPHHIPVTRLLPIAPALAAALWRPRAILLLGVVGLAGLATYVGLSSDPYGWFTVAAMVFISLAAAYAGHLRLQRERSLSEVRAVADTTQKVLLRPVPRRIGPLQIASLYLGATPQARVGGDFYALADTEHGIRLIVGDVRGKGLTALAAAAAVLGSFREASYDAPALDRLAQRLETTLGRADAAVLAEGPAGELFVTAVLVEIPHRGTTGTLLSCGHPPPLIWRGGALGAEVLEYPDPAPPLNLGGILGKPWQPHRFAFGVGDRLLLYTDGVSETRDAAGTFFPLTAWARTQADEAPRQLLDNLLHALRRHSAGRLDDDIAALAVTRTS
jgi:serine phosphatase RsbU (regulator of sigma subunit)